MKSASSPTRNSSFLTTTRQPSTNATTTRSAPLMGARAATARSEASDRSSFGAARCCVMRSYDDTAACACASALQEEGFDAGFGRARRERSSPAVAPFLGDSREVDSSGGNNSGALVINALLSESAPKSLTSSEWGGGGIYTKFVTAGSSRVVRAALIKTDMTYNRLGTRPGDLKSAT